MKLFICKRFLFILYKSSLCTKIHYSKKKVHFTHTQKKIILEKEFILWKIFHAIKKVIL